MTNSKRVASRYLLKQAGTFQYEGNTSMDMAYALTDMVNELKRRLPEGSVTQEARDVKKAILVFEAAVKKALGN